MSLISSITTNSQHRYKHALTSKNPRPRLQGTLPFLLWSIPVDFLGPEGGFQTKKQIRKCVGNAYTTILQDLEQSNLIKVFVVVDGLPESNNEVVILVDSTEIEVVQDLNNHDISHTRISILPDKLPRATSDSS